MHLQNQCKRTETLSNNLPRQGSRAGNFLRNLISRSPDRKGRDMRHNACRWMIGVLGALLALVASSDSVRAGYTPPGGSNCLLGEAVAFVSDFSQWNASQNNQPLLMLEMTPEGERGQMVLWLFWTWLHKPADQGIGGIPPSFPQHPPIGGNWPTFPPPSGGSIEPPIGTIVTGPTNDPPPLQGGGNPPGMGGNPPGMGGNPGNGGVQTDPPTQYVFTNNGPGTSKGPLPGIPPFPNGSTPPSAPAPVAVPEPATLTLLATGTIGLLLYRGMRPRRV